jgi:hypothetical protein
MSLPLQFHGTCSDIYYTFAQKNSSTLNLLPFSLKIPPLRSNYVDLRSESLFFAQNSTSKPFLLLNTPKILHWKNFFISFFKFIACKCNRFILQSIYANDCTYLHIQICKRFINNFSNLMNAISKTQRKIYT